MVARGAGAAGPVLLACHQWDPRGLARRLPSLRAGAWRGGPPLPWRVQCRGPVCAALAAGSGGSGRCPVSPFSPRVSCAVYGGPSRPRVPYPRLLIRHSMRSVRSAGSVSLPLWFSPRVLCVFVRSRSRGVRAPLPLPWLVWRAHLARSRCWALVRPFHAVRAPPRVLPWSRAPIGLLGGGGGPVPFPPYLAWNCVLPVWWVCASGAFQRRGIRWGGGGGLCAVLSDCAARGGSGAGGCLISVRPSAFPGQATKPGVALAMEGVASIPLRFVPACCLRARSVWRPCVLARVRLSIAAPQGASSWGVEAGPAPASLPGAAVLPGGRGDHPHRLGGGAGPAPPWLASRWGGLGGQGGNGTVAPHLPPLWGAACGPLPSPPFVTGASPPGVRVPSGSWSSPGCWVQHGAGGGGGAACEAPSRRGGQGAGGPGGRSASVRPSALFEWATTRGSWEARAPYCSGLLPRAAPGRGPCVVLARWCGFARLLPVAGGAGGAGARGVRAQLLPPPGVAVLSWGGGTYPRPRWGGRAAVPHPLALGGWPVAPVPARRGVVGRRWVSVARGGGVSLPRPALPHSLAGHQGGPLRLRIPGFRRSVAAHGAGAEPLVGSGQCRSKRAVNWGCLARGCARRGCGLPPLGAAAFPGGCGAAIPPAGHRPPTGRGRGGGGGEERFPAVPPWSPGAAVRRPGGAARWFRSRGPSRRLGGRTLLPPPPTPWVPDPRAGPRSGPQLSSLLPRGAGWTGGGAGRAGECWGRQLGSAVSG